MSRTFIAKRSLVFLVVILAPLVAACATSAPSEPAKPPKSVSEGSAERQILVTVRQPRTPSPRGAGSSAGGYGGASAYSMTERTRRTFARLAREYHLVRREGWPIRPLGIYCVVYEIPAERQVTEVISRLAADERVESVQPMNRYQLESSYDDPYVEMQHGMGDMRVWPTHAWTAGRGVTVAVIDTAVDREHPDLASSVVLARDFVGRRTARGNHAERHGTAVAGVIASAANNGVGTVGVAPAAQILALRACWQTDDDTTAGSCTSFTLAKALAFVVERRPQVVNLSLAGPPDPLLERLIRAALDEGVAVVTAYRREGDAVAFPGSVRGVLAVDSSSGSPGLGPRPLSAPGDDILVATPGGGFDFISGSSLAAAHVSGVVALLLEEAPDLEIDRLQEILRRTSRPASGGDHPVLPLVDACAALDQVATGGDCGAAAGSVL